MEFAALTLVGALVGAFSGGGSKAPPPPAAPKYPDVYASGISADADSLAARRGIEAAAASGGKYVGLSPTATDADHAMFNLASRWDSEFLAKYPETLPPNATAAQKQAFDARQVKLKEAFAAANYVKGNPYLEWYGGRPAVNPGKLRTYDFAGLGDAEISKLRSELNLSTADSEAKNQLTLLKKYGNDYQDFALEALKRQDPEGFQGRLDLAKKLRGDLSNDTDIVESDIERDLRNEGISLARQTPQDTGDNELLKRGREAAMRRSLEEFDLGGELSPEQQRQAEQAVRAGGAARGQALSSSGVMREAMGKYNLSSALSQNRLNNLMNVGKQVFGEEESIASTRHDRAQSKMVNLFNAQRTASSDFRSMREENSADNQRRLSNLSAYSSGSPISSGFTTLSGASNGASPYSPFVARGTLLNPNAGAASAGFASNIFAGNTDIYKSQSATAASEAEGRGALLGTAITAGAMYYGNKRT